MGTCLFSRVRHQIASYLLLSSSFYLSFLSFLCGLTGGRLPMIWSYKRPSQPVTIKNAICDAALYNTSNRFPLHHPSGSQEAPSVSRSEYIPRISR
ncbi:uncharacterized protein EV420DRAFT_1554082 [Desarmillaria tabescens]|uniref:Uncharacterized protein n=1 Tax=Armillaria tabescens TaxID=1929756 RepID=A0AA39KB17_ARMTA|nr:uncharacterized protein EV420DRAFT_1554082 [Desarmillaria tabescens]KAK0455518.1 hypothetical protein EV420DRAFT_1554082 [Desarmillaria tabescens]